MNQAIVNPKVLPSFFNKVQIIGPAHLELPKYRAIHKDLALTASQQDCTFEAVNSPLLLTSADVKKSYENNDFAKIRGLEESCQNDLKAVYANIAKNGVKAWTKVESDGKEFYVSFSETGCVWAYTEKNTENPSTQKFESVVQIGSYTQSGKIVGISSYKLTTPTLLADGVISFIVAAAFSSIVADGLGFLITALAIYLCEAAASLGLQAFSFTIPVAAVSAVSFCLVFAIVFISLLLLWNFLYIKYTIRIQIFNWDYSNNWNANGQYLDNAIIYGGSQNVAFNLPKTVKPGEVITPPGFKPIINLDSVCYYAVVIIENDNKIAEGCSVAIEMHKNGANEGFTWAFTCPFMADNKHGADDGIRDPKAYLKSNPWNPTPLGFQTKCTSSGIPIAFALDCLSGAKDELYNVNIHINNA